MGKFNEKAELLPKTTAAEEMNASFASLFSSLDEIGMEAVLVTMAAMIGGATNDQAIAAGDEVLVAHGRKPVMLMQQG